MNIIIDAMGGDNAPNSVVKGAADAASQYKVKITLVGDKQKIEKAASDNDVNLSDFDIEIVHTDIAVTMEDEATSVVRSKKNSSMSIGLNLLRESGDAFVCAGNTGALHTGSSLIVKKIEGIQRSGIATIFPFARPMLMMDAGANISVTSEYLEQWAMMGSIYMKRLFGIENPAVGLLNNGTEEHKGTEILIDTYKRLTGSKLNFIGNVEGKEIPFGQCDVLVTDGFTGNIVLKLVEGMGKFMFSTLKDMYTANAATKISYLLMKDKLKGLKNNFDASEHGGAPLLGLSKPVIKAHGSSDALAVKNAVRQAIAFVKTNIIEEIAVEAKKYKEASKVES